MEVELRSPGHGASAEDPAGEGWYCGAKLKQPKPEWLWCTNRAGYKTNHPKIGRCHLHGGKTETHNQAAAVEVMRRACDRLGVPIENADPGGTLIDLVREAAGNVEFYRSLVGELPIHPGPDRFVAGGADDDGVEIEAHWERGESGVYGRTYHQSGIPTGEAKRHILVQMYDDERDRLARYSKEALNAGVEERRVRLQEADAREFFEGIGAAIKAAKLTPEQTEVFRATLIARFRGSVDGGGPAGSA
jgi:hypothetical protein